MTVLEMETTIREQMIDDKEICLLKTLFGERATKETIEYLTEGINVDTENVNYMLMLSSLGFRDGWEYFPERIVPRIKGLHKFYQVRTASKIPWLLQQMDKLDAAGVEYMFIKGIAMYSHYAPNRPRLMGDFDLFADASDREKVLQCLLCEGMTVTNEEKKELTFVPKDNGGKKLALDVNFYPLRKFNSKELFPKMWNEGTLISFYGHRVKVPSYRDMFINTLCNRFHNYSRNESPLRRMKWLYDCACVAEQAAQNTNRLKASDILKRSDEIGSRYAVMVLLPMFNQIFPDYIENDVSEYSGRDSKQYMKWLKLNIKVHSRYSDTQKRLKESQRPDSIRKYIASTKRNYYKYKLDKLGGLTDESFSKRILCVTKCDNYFQVARKYTKKMLKR